MENKIIARNSRVIGKYFNTSVEMGEDLLKRNEENIKEFINKYNEELFEFDYDKFKEFMKNINISITRVYQKKEERKKYYLNELGLFTNDDEDDMCIFKGHLTIYIYVDDIIYEEDNYYKVINGNKKLIYNEDSEEFNICDNYFIRTILFDNNKTIKEKVNEINDAIPDTFLSKVKINNIKRLECIYPYKDILILMDNGLLFVNDKLYNDNVRDICYLTTCHCYIIYNDESVEDYINDFEDWCNIYNHKKTLSYNNLFLVTLDENKKVVIETNCAIEVGNDFDYDNCIPIVMLGIDDVIYRVEEEYPRLYLIVGNKEIEFPLDIHVWK